ncbi:MAG: glycosyltransferase family 2 protein [Lachnospiraceae bacterium]|nr:glycosyltransferase family 2 protein [Lachnospiraceae bacterium]
MEKKTLLTVFTPAYNRAKEIRTAYESLKRQTNKGFVWIVVDDGSTDDTADVIKGFIDEGKVDIKYIFRENGGKMRAHNTGVMNCETELFVCLDSDDHLSDTAVDDILNAWRDAGEKAADGTGQEKLAGIIAYKGENVVRVLNGHTFPKKPDRMISFRELYRSGFKGETTLVLRTRLLRENPFPEIEGEKYVPEDVVYDRIDDGHVFYLLPRILTICELMSRGLTDRAKELRYEAPVGWFIYYYQRAMSWPWSLMRLKFAAHYLRFRGAVDIKYKNEYRLPRKLVIAGIPGFIVLTLLRKR